MHQEAHPPPTFITFENVAIEQSIVARFEQQVARYPDRLAVMTPELQFTYTELNQAANRIARAVLAHVGKREEPVALFFQHGAFLIAAIMGILKAGKIYISLDPLESPTRTADVLECSQAKLLLTNTKNLSQARQLAQGGQSILNCEDIDAAVATGNLDEPISPEMPAVILYTSGSTGRPKLVLHNQRNILVETRNYTNDLRIGSEDRLALWHSCSYANPIRGIYGALLNGAAVFPFDLTIQGFEPLDEWIRAHRITIIHTLATTFRRFCDTLSKDATFPSLRILRLGGEPINTDDVQRFQRHFSSHCVLVHAMGPTETFTIRRHFIGHDWRGNDSKIPVGYAVPDKEVLLLDEAGREVAAGQIGEIAVKSKYLALGYWGRPDLTEAAFIPGADGDKRIYLTGDLGLMLSDGCLIHMGRKDFQIKIRGYRVEVSDIEAAFSELDSVQASVVHAHSNNAGEQRLVAYIVPAPGVAPTVSALRRALAQTLPDYMIPSAFVFLETFPLLPNGKIDRRALPLPNKGRPFLDVSYVAPHTSTEQELAKIWGEVLDLEQVGIHDNFFELGGHSLLATRVISRLRDTFQTEVPLESLFESPTIAVIASIIEKTRGGAGTRESAIVPIPRETKRIKRPSSTKA